MDILQRILELLIEQNKIIEEVFEREKLKNIDNFYALDNIRYQLEELKDEIKEGF